MSSGSSFTAKAGQVLLGAVILSFAPLIGSMVDKGDHYFLWPYAAFTLGVIAIFAVYHRFSGNAPE